MERRRTFVHPLGTPVGLAGLDIASDEQPSLADAYASELGLRFATDAGGDSLDIGAHRVRLLAADTASAVIHLIGGAGASVDLFGVRFELNGQP